VKKEVVQTTGAYVKRKTLKGLMNKSAAEGYKRY
jgi:hypothetical protein